MLTVAWADLGDGSRWYALVMETPFVRAHVYAPGRAGLTTTWTWEVTLGLPGVVSAQVDGHAADCEAAKQAAVAAASEMVLGIADRAVTALAGLAAGPEPTRYTFTIPRPGWPDDSERVDVVPARGAWDRGPILGWFIVRGQNDFWTRDRTGFEFRPGRPEQPEHTRWATLAEALVEAAEHAVPHMVVAMAEQQGARAKLRVEAEEEVTRG